MSRVTVCPVAVTKDRFRLGVIPTAERALAGSQESLDRVSTSASIGSVARDSFCMFLAITFTRKRLTGGSVQAPHQRARAPARQKRRPPRNATARQSQPPALMPI